MPFQNVELDISVTQFRARCLELIQQVESGGEGC
jgi:antitoxin (DNA-binding transcriptional repressor) of toxin-antitoxin stability system